MCSEFYFSACPLYMFRAAHTPIIRSTILTVSTAIGKIHTNLDKTYTLRIGYAAYFSSPSLYELYQWLLIQLKLYS